MRTRSILAICAIAFGTPALSHEGHHHTPSPHSSAMQGGICQYHASDWNMARIERMFKTMPEYTRMNLQHVLRHAELYDGRDDGVWGPKTSCALKAVATHYPAPMNDSALVAFFEYLLDGGFISDFPGTPNNVPHRGVLY
jgi:hypothetical protein